MFDVSGEDVHRNDEGGVESEWTGGKVEEMVGNRGRVESKDEEGRGERRQIGRAHV